jgi:hypothetical protein
MLSGCTNGEDKAQEIDPDARCLRLHNTMDFICIVRGHSLFCTPDGCVPLNGLTPE